VGEATAVVGHVTSSDGTRIGYHRSGEGPPLVLVHGAASAHWSFRFFVPELVERFTVYALDRRGRGESGDAADYALEREVEDLAAVVDSLDGPTVVFGHSFGATVALAAAPLAGNLRALVLYEASPGLQVVADEDLERVKELVARDEREEAMAEALLLFGLAPDELEQLRASPTWPARVALAHTLAREVRAEQAYRLDPERLREVAAPALLLLGEESPDWARKSTEEIRAALPDARVAVLRGQGHVATTMAPELVAAEVARFLKDG
jgi:pimeloyl-ACP methyl ester carboxylesterase